MRHLKAMGIGAAVLLCVLFVIIGPEGPKGGLFGNIGFFGFLGMMVVCTAGLALIPFLLLSWLIGLLVLLAIGDRGGPAAAAEEESPEAKAFAAFMRAGGVSSEKVEKVAEYIRRSKAEGKPEESIAWSMSHAGWSRAVIEEAERQYARWEASGRGG